LVSYIEEKYLVMVFQNKVLRRKFGPKRDKVTGEWRGPYHEELNEMYCSTNTIRVIES
jgi:hypothetical protein